MGFESFKPLTNEQKEETKSRVLSDAELINNGAEISDRGTIQPTHEDKEKAREEMEKGYIKEGVTDFTFGLNFGMEVRAKEEKVTEVLNDVDVNDVMSYGERDFQETLKPFITAGLSATKNFGEDADIQYLPWTTEGGEDNSGYLFIKKDAINKAIAEGRLVITIDDEDTLEIKSSIA